MFTEKALNKAKADLYNIIANNAYKDFIRANTNRQGKQYKKHRPYNLGHDTNAAREVYSLIYGKQPEDITEDQEKQVKAFLLNYRINRREYLKNVGGNEYHNAI